MTRPNPPTSSSKKPTQIQLQTDINNDQEFINFTKRKGLLVIDVYAEWCVPCSAMATTLKKLKVEIGGDKLWFAVAKSDYISYLTMFRNRSEPTWLFLVDEKVVKIMFGAGAPKLAKSIASELRKLEAQNEGTLSDPGFITVEKLASLEKADFIMFSADEKKEICLKLLKDNIEVDSDHEKGPILETDNSATQLNSPTNELETLLSSPNELKENLQLKKDSEDDLMQSNLEGTDDNDTNRNEGEVQELQPSKLLDKVDQEKGTELESNNTPQQDKCTSTIEHQIDEL